MNRDQIREERKERKEVRPLCCQTISLSEDRQEIEN